MPRPKDHAGKDFESRHQRFAKTGAVPREFKGFRDRMVPTRSVPCPICKVGVDEFCIKADGSKAATCHVPRRRMAVRALNNQEN